MYCANKQNVTELSPTIQPASLIFVLRSRASTLKQLLVRPKYPTPTKDVCGPVYYITCGSSEVSRHIQEDPGHSFDLDNVQSLDRESRLVQVGWRGERGNLHQNSQTLQGRGPIPSPKSFGQFVGVTHAQSTWPLPMVGESSVTFYLFKVFNLL